MNQQVTVALNVGKELTLKICYDISKARLCAFHIHKASIITPCEKNEII
jgi:hypothetical protein